MATVDVHDRVSVDMSSLNFSNWLGGSHYMFDQWSYLIKNGPFTEEFHGYGIGLDMRGEPTRGVVTSYEFYDRNHLAAFIEGFKVTASEIVRAAKSNTLNDDYAVFAKMLKGNDFISGGNLSDVLVGFGGKDWIEGQRGADQLWGGRDADTFVFNSVEDSTTNWRGRDTIFDFKQFEGDRIDLRNIDANTKKGGDQIFEFIGDQKFSKTAGELRYERKLGDTIVHGDVNGDGKADFSIVIDPIIKLQNGDFLL